LYNKKVSFIVKNCFIVVDIGVPVVGM
jgi:hypothetical protein